MAEFKVIIVGSGLAGSLLANGLINHNVQVEVYERLARDAKREGYQIRLGSSALMGMRTCLTSTQKDLVVKRFGRSNGKFASAPIIYDKKFQVILNANRFPAYDKSAPINRKILRDILAEPVDAAGKVQYGKSFDRYEILNPGKSREKVRVWFDDGTSTEGDILIAADGAHSKINQQVGLDNLMSLTSHWSFATKTDLPTDKFLHMSKELLQSPILVSSDNRAMYFCAYLPDQVNPPDTDRSEQDTSPAFDESLSSCFLGYHVPVEDVPKNPQEFTLEEKWAFLKEQFSKYWSPKYGEIIDILWGSDVYCYQSRVSTRPQVDWRKKVQSEQTPEKGHPRVMFLGDAIHAMLPNRGMGGNQAMRDTSVLLPILLDLAEKAKAATDGLEPKVLTAACQNYEAEMIPRGFGWVQKSGGQSLMMADTATWTGSIWLTTMGLLLDVAYGVYWLSSFVVKSKYIDEAPEFAE